MSKREYLIVTEPERLKEFGFEYWEDEFIAVYEHKLNIAVYEHKLNTENSCMNFINLSVNGEWALGYIVENNKDIDEMMLTLYDLITAGIVKKVEEE